MALLCNLELETTIQRCNNLIALMIANYAFSFVYKNMYFKLSRATVFISHIRSDNLETIKIQHEIAYLKPPTITSI